MKLMLKGLVAAGLMAGASLMSAPVLAQDAGFYIGGGLGQSKWDIDSSGLSGTTDDKDTAWKIFGGYQVNKYFGVEGGYVDLGNASFTGTLASPIPPFPAGTPVSLNLDSKAWFVSVVGTLPISNQFSLLGKIGVSRSDTDATAAVAGLAGSANEKTTEATYGLGVRFDINKNFGVRAEWDRFRVGGDDVGGKGDIDLFTINAIFRF
jgi:OOP family OmpA-OmpF porin